MREFAVHLGVEAAAAELALVRGDRVHLRVDRVGDVDVGARVERDRHRIAVRRVVGEEIEVREALRRQARVVDQQMIVVEIGAAMREHRGRRVFLDHGVHHSHEVAGLDVLDALGPVLVEDLQFAAEDLGSEPRLREPHVEILRDRGDDHDDVRAAAPHLGERAADADLEVVGMRADADHGPAGVARGERLGLRLQRNGAIAFHERAILRSSCQGATLYR